MSLSLWKIGTHLYHTHLRSVVILFERCYFQWGWRCTKRKSNYGLTGVHRQAPSHKSSTGLSKSVQFYSARKCWNPGGSHIPSLDQYSRRLLDPHVELLSRNCREIKGSEMMRARGLTDCSSSDKANVSRCSDATVFDASSRHKEFVGERQFQPSDDALSLLY